MTAQLNPDDPIAILWKRVKRQGAYHNKPITYSEFRAIVEGIGGKDADGKDIDVPKPAAKNLITANSPQLESAQSVTDLPKTYSTGNAKAGSEEEMSKRVHEVLDAAKNKTSDPDPLVHIAWVIDGLDIYQRTDGKRGHSLEKCKQYVISQVLHLLAQARVDQRAEDNKRLRDLLERLNLEFEVIRCNKCGEPWVSSDPHDIVLEYLAQITNPQEGK